MQAPARALPSDVRLVCCLTCLLSDYSPAGTAWDSGSGTFTREWVLVDLWALRVRRAVYQSRLRKRRTGGLSSSASASRSMTMKVADSCPS